MDQNEYAARILQGTRKGDVVKVPGGILVTRSKWGGYWVKGRFMGWNKGGAMSYTQAYEYLMQCFQETPKTLT